MQQNWDVEADVVVVGFGAAGVAASVTAHDMGADVVILEKAPEGQEGGNTRVAGQGYLNTSSAEDGAAYLTALCGPYTVPRGDGEGLGGGDAPEQCLARKSRWCCVKKVRERHAVREMKEDPSEPSCRGRLQTAMSCFGQKLR